ncbi:MAG: xanthine dehydrogenase family protein molybdopterin-binding subunit [Betaproteobacteria bacterium]
MNPFRMRPLQSKLAGNVSRRVFLQSTAAAGAGLTLGIWFDDAAAQMAASSTAAVGGTFAPNAFLRIAKDNTVTVVCKHLEMGQGVFTGLPTLVAEELDAAWSQVRTVGAPADGKLYNNLLFGSAQATGGSTAIANSFEQYRQAGAAARAMLVAAAAEQWKVPAESVQVKNGVVFHANGKKATFGDLADAAGRQPVPVLASIKLKDAKDFVFIGKHVPRTDSKAKSNGTAIFTQDLKLPDMLTAVVAHAPRFGQALKSFDSSAVTAVPGVRFVIEIPTGVAVVATTFWAAKKGRDALKLEWDDATGFKMSSADIMADYKKLAATPGKLARNDADAAKAIAGAAKKLEASFEFPYLAHAPMEPLNCVVKLTNDACEIWNGEQFQSIDQMHIAKYTGLKPEQIRLNMLYAGGSFGRRASTTSDYLIEAVSIAVALVKGGHAGIPVKLVWTREDDMRGGYYRPLYLHTIAAGLDAAGNIDGWQHRIVGQSIMTGSVFESMMVKDGVDATSVEGAANLPYAIPNLAVELHTVKLGVPVLWWRSVGSTHTAFSTETFIDELAVAAGKDPVVFRRSMLAKHPRHLAVLDLVADKAGWSKPLAAGKSGEKRGRGIALHESFGTVVAQVAEVTVTNDGKYTVDRVVCAVDCGIAVNPDVIRAQMEGGIGFGLSAAMMGRITLKDGVVEESNFHNYPVLRINEMPAIDVHIVPSTNKPTGVGEPAVPVIGPALANALAVATGKRVRTLPIALG